MTREKSVKFKCDCGHIMGHRYVDTIELLNRITYWKCSKCKELYSVKINISKKTL